MVREAASLLIASKIYATVFLLATTLSSIPNTSLAYRLPLNALRHHSMSHDVKRCHVLAKAAPHKIEDSLLLSFEGVASVNKAPAFSFSRDRALCSWRAGCNHYSSSSLHSTDSPIANVDDGNDEDGDKDEGLSSNEGGGMDVDDADDVDPAATGVSNNSSANSFSIDGVQSNGGSSRTKAILSKLKFWEDTGGEDGLTTRQRLAKMGLSALLSYGFVSNMSYSIAVSVAWYGFSKKTRLSPLAPGQWPAFLAVYAGFWAFNNVIRPARFALAVAVTPYFDGAVQFVRDKANCNKAVAIGLVVFLANVCGTLAVMSLGVSLAGAASGVPIFPPKT